MDKEEYKKRFQNGFNILCSGQKSNYTVWSDIIHLYAYSISNGALNVLRENETFNEVWEERENKYLSIINTYSKKEQNIIVQMFALLVLEYEREPFQDLFGAMFMMLDFGQKNKGQFFTPYDVCRLMSDATMDRKEVGKQVHKKGYISIYDPACGAGATLIAAAERCNEMFKRLNYQSHVYFVGQDVDEMAALICYIQLSLLGLAGYVSVGNTLTEPAVKDLHRIYFTPIYFNDVWTFRRMFHNLDLFMNEKEDGRK